MQEVYDFLKDCNCYFLATTEGDQPRVRPFGSAGIFDEKLYIQTGKIKDVAKQMQANPKVEICGYNGDNWIRIEATAIEDDRNEIRQRFLDANPSLQGMYKADDGNCQVLYLKDATARLCSFGAETKVIQF